LSFTPEEYDTFVYLKRKRNQNVTRLMMTDDDRLRRAIKWVRLLVEHNDLGGEILDKTENRIAIEVPRVARSSSLTIDLKRREEELGRPIRIGLIGCGEMGTDIFVQTARMQGITVTAAATRTMASAHLALKVAGRDDFVVAETTAAMDRAIDAGKLAITEDARAVCASEHVDVVIDATGKPDVGAEMGMLAMENGKHLVMMNVEADVTIGAYLKHEAARLGVVYTLGAGDEPSTCMELIDFLTSLGYPIIAAGKGKNNPLNHDATPDMYEEEARRRNMNPRLLVEFVDGSKTMVEMAAISNATGLRPDKPGMHGPAADLSQLASTLCPIADGGILSRTGVVDYTVGKGVAPGVFVIAKAPNARIHERMSDLKMGAGPYFHFVRPFHLTSLEVPLTCARAVLYKTADMQPLNTPVSEVCALAKKDLKPGDKLDAIGEYTYRSWIMTVEEARQAHAIPCGLLEKASVIKPVRKGELLTYNNIAVVSTSSIVQMRKRQDEMLRQTLQTT
jgi:predicted homoserine dehydrogenase-like protein